jgi:hypothetical protein
MAASKIAITIDDRMLKHVSQTEARLFRRPLRKN